MGTQSKHSSLDCASLQPCIADQYDIQSRSGILRHISQLSSLGIDSRDKFPDFCIVFSITLEYSTVVTVILPCLPFPPFATVIDH